MTSIARATAIATALLAFGGAAFAAGGTVTAITATPVAVFPNESISYKVVISQGSYGVDCNMYVSLKNAAKVEVKGSKHNVQSQNNTYEYSSSFSAPAPGNYTLEATAGAPDSQNVSCTGQAVVNLTVKDNMAISAHPAVMTVNPKPHLPGPVLPPQQRAH